MRTKHTGIFQRTIIETPQEWFSGGGGLLGSVNSVSAVAECAKRARQAFRKVFNLPPEDTSTKNGNVVVHLDSSRRPLTDAQDRAENWTVFENLSRRDLRNNPIAEDVRALLFLAEEFYLTRERPEALARNENLLSLVMRIAELDKQIAVAPYEDKVRYGQKSLRRLRRMRRGKKKKGDAKKTLWLGVIRRLIRRYPKWTNHAIAKEARKNPPTPLKPAGLSTLQRWAKDLRRST
jgi:hypothetical protein